MTRRHSAWQVIGACTAFALIHSVLASRQVKRLAEQRMGRQRYRGLYRLGFVLQSLIMLGGAVPWFLKLPDRELYRLRGITVWLSRGVQLASLAGLFWTFRTIGIQRFLGLTQTQTLLRNEMPPHTPEAQGPPPDGYGNIDARGPFRFMRHPYNLPVLGLMWTLPRMTVNRATLATALSLYTLVGSLHEERRLRAQFGDAAYDRYARNVPFTLPRLPFVPRNGSLPYEPHPAEKSVRV